MAKRTLVLAAIAAALVTVGAQPASAEWFDEGKALKKGENPIFKLEGDFRIKGGVGTVECSKGVFGFLELTGGTTDGHLNEFNVNVPEECEIAGGLVLLTGGTTTLKSMVLTAGAKAVNDEGLSIKISGLSLHYEFKNGFKLTLTSIAGSPLVAVPDLAAKIGKVFATGKLSSNAGEMNASGVLTVLAGANGTYGI